MRDAVTAAIHLNIFNQHADRVKVANLHQMVNVLQSVILSKDDKMVLTPTYHCFQDVQGASGAKLLNTDLYVRIYDSREGKYLQFRLQHRWIMMVKSIFPSQILIPAKDITSLPVRTLVKHF
jgi:alpha-L-arabinofuranosidase